MTVIGAKQIKGKWTLLADSAVTIGQVMTNAGDSYRPKIREMLGKNVDIVVASCGAIKDIDFISNMLEERLANNKINTTNSLRYFIQETLIDARKELKELTDNPSAAFIILVPKTNTLLIADEYSVTEVKDYAEIVFGSGDQRFYKAHKREDFFSAFKHAVLCDEFCEFPIITYRDGDVRYRNERDKDEDFYSYKDYTDVRDERAALNCCIQEREPDLIGRDTNQSL